MMPRVKTVRIHTNVWTIYLERSNSKRISTNLSWAIYSTRCPSVNTAIFISSMLVMLHARPPIINQNPYDRPKRSKYYPPDAQLQRLYRDETLMHHDLFEKLFITSCTPNVSPILTMKKSFFPLNLIKNAYQPKNWHRHSSSRPLNHAIPPTLTEDHPKYIPN